MRRSGAWFLAAGHVAPVPIEGLGQPQSFLFESDVERDDQAVATFRAAPIDAGDRPEIAPGAKVTAFFGLDGGLMQAVPLIVDDPSPEFGAGVSLIVTMRDPGSDAKGWRVDRVWPVAFSLRRVVETIAQRLRLTPDAADAPAAEFDRHQSESDWAYLSRLSSAAGCRFWISGDTLHFRRVPDREVKNVFQYGAGKSFVRFRAFIERGQQVGAVGDVEAQGYDELADEAVIGRVGADNETRPRLAPTYQGLEVNLDTGTARPIGARIVTDASTEAEAKALADAERERRLAGLQRAEFESLPVPDRRAGDIIQIEGVNRRSAGLWRVRKVTHEIGPGGYKMSHELDRETMGATTPGGNTRQVQQQLVRQDESTTPEDVVVDLNTGTIAP